MWKWKGVGALKEVRGGYGVGLWKTIRKGSWLSFEKINGVAISL